MSNLIQNRDFEQERDNQQLLFSAFQQLDVYQLARLLVAAKLPKYSRWLKQATILTLADTISSDCPNYYQTLAEKASTTLDTSISIDTAKKTLSRHASAIYDHIRH